MSAKPPRLLLGGLSGRIYVTTKYTEDEKGNIVSEIKHDVTRDFFVIEMLRAQDKFDELGDE